MTWVPVLRVAALPSLMISRTEAPSAVPVLRTSGIG